jgi:hypothetical protein
LFVLPFVPVLEVVACKFLPLSPHFLKPGEALCSALDQALSFFKNEKVVPLSFMCKLRTRLISDWKTELSKWKVAFCYPIMFISPVVFFFVFCRFADLLVLFSFPGLTKSGSRFVLHATQTGSSL